MKLVSNLESFIIQFNENENLSSLIIHYIQKNPLLQKMLIKSGLDSLEELTEDLRSYSSSLSIKDFKLGSKKIAIKNKRQKEINFLDGLLFLKYEEDGILDILEDLGVRLDELSEYLSGRMKLDEDQESSLEVFKSCDPNHFVERNDISLEIIKKLNHHDNNNIILFGKEGTGKSTLLEYLPQYLEKDVFVKKIEAIDLFQSTQNFGDFEANIKHVISELKKNNDQSVLILDDYHHLIDSGIVRNPEILFDFFKSELKDNKVSIVIVVSDKFFNKNKNKEFVKRFFNPIKVPDLSNKETTQYIFKRLSQFEDHYKIKIKKNIVNYIIENSRNYTELSNPEKIIKILDLLFSKFYKKNIKTDDIDYILYKFGKKKTNDNKLDVEEIKNYIKSKLYGQDHAVEAVVDDISIYLAGLNEPNKPIGSFLFVGPTGVGKTELSRQLKSALAIEDTHLLHYDMSEYMEAHTVSKLIGSPPGYVGFDSTTSISDKMKEISEDINIILFDEIEKAHPKVMNLMLQMLEEGRITDSKGLESNFSNSIIILTSNQGARTATVKNIGLSKSSVNKQKAKKEVTNFFSPELLNRLSSTINFNSLENDNTEILYNITKRHIKELITDKLSNVTVEDSVLEFIIKKGYNSSYGARNIKNTIKKLLLKGISLETLKNPKRKIKVSSDGERILIN